jgi:8-oxo-dGTP pyrophosphatase MutT (NUDIX family)
MKITEIVDPEVEHFRQLRQTGFYGKAGAGSLFLAKSTCRLGIAHRSNNPPPHHVEQPGTYGTVGGAIDPNENPLEAAIREVRQEISYAKRRGDHLQELDVFRKNDFVYTTFLYVVVEEFKPVLNWENQGFVWVEFGQWPQPLHFGLKATLAKPQCLDIIKTEILKNRTT